MILSALLCLAYTTTDECLPKPSVDIESEALVSTLNCTEVTDEPVYPTTGGFIRPGCSLLTALPIESHTPSKHT